MIRDPPRPGRPIHIYKGSQLLLHFDVDLITLFERGSAFISAFCCPWMCPNSEHHFLHFFSPSLAGTGCSFIHKRKVNTIELKWTQSIFKGNLQDDGHIVPQYALGWEICCHRSGVKGRFEQIAKQAEAKRQESEEMVARNMESDDEKKDSKTVVIPKEVKSPEPSQNKIEQEHTVALVVTLTDQTMAESIGEENKESTKQVEKKEEPKVQDNEILCENNGREEFIIDTRFNSTFPPTRQCSNEVNVVEHSFFNRVFFTIAFLKTFL
ncbi:hypothetical protein BLNAU_19902 [Blattamonas nauphoetae]|uniref:Uncharacterized protein n=2 Tax=Blattamonas nauphoetae TaxID=2049346 RepID=A0ABQ9X0Q8_9EUKA|nr:hypothetical protein BLNAU_19902 [Blattamonas nauphoetae]